MDIETERQTLERLEAKLVEATSAATKLEEERRRLSFDALSGADAKARKDLDRLNSSSAVADFEISNARSAVEEARRRLAAAEREDQLADQRTKAERALKLADRLEQLGRELDAGLLASATAAEGIEDVLSELNYELDFRSPTVAHFKALIDRIVSTAYMLQPSGRTRPDGQPVAGTLKQRHIPPGERMTGQGITAGQASTIRRTAAQILGDKSEAA